MNRKSPAKSYVVEGIAEIAVRRGRVSHQVKWLGYPSSQNTWEPLENLRNCESLIRECETKMIRNLNGHYFKKRRCYGFECGSEPEEIVDVFRFSGVKVAKVKFVESKEIHFVLLDEVKEKYPQLLLKFYLGVALNSID